jgi:hypothetical protein
MIEYATRSRAVAQDLTPFVELSERSGMPLHEVVEYAVNGSLRPVMERIQMRRNPQARLAELRKLSRPGPALPQSARTRPYDGPLHYHVPVGS